MSELFRAMASSCPRRTEEASHGVVSSSFEEDCPVKEEERRTSGVGSRTRRESVEQVNTHRDLRTRAVVKALM